MKIATWNLERPTATARRLTAIHEIIKGINADIWVFTETNTIVIPGDDYHVMHSADPHYDGNPKYYKAG